MASDRAVVQSLDRALSILDVLRFSDHALALGEVAARAGLPKSTTHRLLATLERRGFAARDTETGAYRLGLKHVTPVGAGPEIRSVLRDLARRSGETANLGALVGHEVLYVDRADSPQALRWQLGVGSRVPVHCSALGKAILASFPPPEDGQHLPRRLRQITPNTITDRAGLLAELEAVRARGYALDEEEFMQGVRCVAVSVLATSGHEVRAALSLAGPAFRLTRRRAVSQVGALRRAAATVARLLGEQGLLTAQAPMPTDA
jgi:DNA-binding IclR family transcriptional regulator